MIFLERVRKESLSQILSIFVAGLPFKANVFVNWFPVTREDGVERAAANRLIIAAGADDRGVVGDRKSVKWSTNVCVWIHKPHEAIPYNLRTTRVRRFPADGTIHGPVPSSFDVHA